MREAARLGATGIKVFGDVPADRLSALVAEAHRAGLRVWSRAVLSPTRPQQVADAGVDGVSHADQLLWAAVPAGTVIGDRAERDRLLPGLRPDDPAVDAVLTTLRERGAVLEPTLLVMQLGRVRDEGRPGPLEGVPAWAVAAARMAHALGVPIVAGTDALGTETPNIHAELQLLVSQVGLSPLEAIQAATQHGARVLGLADSVGTVAVGKGADLVVLRADPAADIRNTQTLRYVIRAGQLFEPGERWEAPPLASPPPPDRGSGARPE